MPTVPYISQPRVGLNALPGARVNPNAPIEAFGGGIAAQQPDLSGAANVAGNVAEQNALDRQRIRSEAALEADQVAVTHAVSATTTSVNDMLHGPDGLFNRKGNNAFTIDQDAYDQYGKTVADIRSQLANDRQRAVYDKHVLNQWDAIDSQVQPYIAAQRQVFDKEGVDAGILANKNAAIAAPLNPVVVEQAITTNQALIAAWSHRLGMPDDAINNARADAASDIHLAVIQSMLSSPTNPNRDQMASAYFDKHKDDLVGKDLLDAERLTKASAAEGNVLRTADKIIAGAVDEQAAIVEAAKIENGVLRKDVEDRITFVFNRKDGIKRADQQAAFEKAYPILKANGYDMSKVPQPLRDAMGAMHDQNLVSEAQQQARLAATGGPGDAEQEMALTNEAVIDPESFMARKILDVPGLNTVQQRRLLTLQKGAVARALVPLQHDLTRAETDLRTAKRKLDADPTNREAISAWKDAVLEKIRAENLVNAHRRSPMAEPVEPTAHSTAPTVSGPSAPAPTRPPLGLTPLTLKPPTPSMLVDIATYGPGYAAVLRSHGFDAPDHVVLPSTEPAKPAEKKPAVHETVVKRGPDGKIQSTTTTVTKPED